MTDIITQSDLATTTFAERGSGQRLPPSQESAELIDHLFLVVTEDVAGDLGAVGHVHVVEVDATFDELRVVLPDGGGQGCLSGGILCAGEWPPARTANPA